MLVLCALPAHGPNAVHVRKSPQTSWINARIEPSSKSHAIFPSARSSTRARQGFLVALPNEVRVYSESTMVVCTPSEDTIGMCFGTLGREEGALVTTHRGGALRVRLLARQAALDAAGVKVRTPRSARRSLFAPAIIAPL